MGDRLMKAHIIGGQERGESKQLPEDGWKGAYESGEVKEPPYALAALAELYEINSTHKACVDAKTTNIVGLGYKFVPILESADESERQRLEEFFHGCNPEMTFTGVMRAVWTDVETVGNGYIEVARNGSGEIDGLYHVPATTVRIRCDRKGFVQIRDGRTRQFRALGGEPIRDAGATNEIIHLRKYTPQSSYYGVPDILPAVAAIAGDRAAANYNVSFFEHNAVPRMAVICEGGQMSQELLRQIRRFMESEIKGQAHRTLVLEVPGGDTKLRLERLAEGNSEEAGFLGYRCANRDEILMVHRVPPSKIAIVENANLANSKDQDKTFREQVVRPEQRRVEFKINQMIREQMGINDWEFHFREMDLSEELQQAQVAEIYAGIGVWTPEEIRAKQGL
ncbi:MAG: phage portal protein [candidate division WS1 bacterium]|jgi:PBSX family phage portal protein|nr:phage portal protein [candidate division WS1 bacterium]